MCNQTFSNLQLINLPQVTNPYLNLALEEYLVRHFPADASYLLLYENDAAVVLGKHQNVVEEVNQLFCQQNDIPILRRISGGGTVFHGPGNLNFSFIVPHNMTDVNNYRRFLQPIIEVLKRRDIPAKQDDANNLVLDDKKISGNAQFTSGGRLLSHGTLLVNAKLNHLLPAIKPGQGWKISSRSTKSRRAPVMNLADYPGAEKVTSAAIGNDLQDWVLSSGGRLVEPNRAQWEEIKALADSRYRSAEWTLGRSPACRMEREVTIGGSRGCLHLALDRGKVTYVHFDGPTEMDVMLRRLEGHWYRPSVLEANLPKPEADALLMQLF